MHTKYTGPIKKVSVSWARFYLQLGLPGTLKLWIWTNISQGIYLLTMIASLYHSNMNKCGECKKLFCPLMR